MTRYKLLEPSALLVRLALLISISAACGCTIIGWVWNTVTPPEKIKPRYKIPKSKSGQLLILLEESEHLVAHPGAKTHLYRQLKEEFIKNKIVESVVDRNRFVIAQLANPAFHSLTAVEKGKSVDADIVLSLEIKRFTLKEKLQEQWDGKCELRIKLFDVAEDKILWPDELSIEGEPVTCIVKPEGNRSVDPDYHKKFTRKVINEIADKVAKLFYEYEKDTRGKLSGEES